MLVGRHRQRAGGGGTVVVYKARECSLQMPGITTAVKTANPEALYGPALPKGKHHAPRHITEGKIRSVDHRTLDGVDHRALDAHLECANVPAR